VCSASGALRGGGGGGYVGGLVVSCGVDAFGRSGSFDGGGCNGCGKDVCWCRFCL